MNQTSQMDCDKIPDMKIGRDPAKARAARTLMKRRRWAEELRAAGWTVKEPSDDQGH